MSLTMEAQTLCAGDYVEPPNCNGWHKVLGIGDGFVPEVIRINVNGGAWFVRPTFTVSVAFSGVELCTIDHDAQAAKVAF